MKVLTKTVARVLFALPFGIFGIFHFIFGSQMVGIVPAWIPGGGLFWVYIIGVALIIASVFIIGNLKYAHIIAFLLGVLLIIFILTIHIPGLFNVLSFHTSMTNLLKDLALLGGAWTYAGILKKTE
jgi:uncharacterized membrane protein